MTSALKGSLPSSVVATMPIKSHNSLTLTSSGTAKGAVSTQVLLSPDDNASDSVFMLASGHASVNRASGKSKTMPLKFAKSIPSTRGVSGSLAKRQAEREAQPEWREQVMPRRSVP